MCREPSYPQRKQLNHIPPNWVRSDAIFFITVNCKDRGKHQLNNLKISNAIFESLQFRVQLHQWYIYLWLIMHDHIHALLSFSKETSMKESISAWKKFTARELNIVWQRGFFDHRIRDDASFREKAKYIESNPVRAGFIQNVEEWPYVWGSKDFYFDG